MKKFNLAFTALVFTGVFSDFDKAANAAHPGSGSSFTETETENGSALTFTDAYGKPETLQVNDAVREVFDEQAAFIGYERVSTWVISEANPVLASIPANTAAN